MAAASALDVELLTRRDRSAQHPNQSEILYSAEQAREDGLEAWAAQNVIVRDGPEKDRLYRVLRSPWHAVLEALAGPPGINQVTIRASVQSGKTAALIIAALYHQALGKSVLFYEPDDPLRRLIAKRIIAWGRACLAPELAAAFAPERPPFVRVAKGGGRLEVLSAGAAGAGLSRTANVVIIDELRAFKMDLLQELADRMVSFGTDALLITASSAGYIGECKTSSEYDKSDKQAWYLKCPACSAESTAAWDQVDFKTERYKMPCCGIGLDDSELASAINEGAWKETAIPKVPGTRGFHMDCFSGSAFETLAGLKRSFIHAREHQKQTGSMKEIAAFEMGRLARPHNPALSGAVNSEKVMAHCREAYDPEIMPAWSSVLIVAVDVQDNYLELERSAFGAVEVEDAASATNVRGWGGQSREHQGLRFNGKWYRLRRAALDVRKLHGDPGQPAVWNSLAEVVEQTCRHAGGLDIRPCMAGIDIGGHHTADVAAFVREQGGAYQCLKGRGPGQHFGILARKSITVESIEQYGPAGLMLCCVNSAKSNLFSMLRTAIAGDRPQSLIWPQLEDYYGPEQYEQLCGERLVRQVNKKTGSTYAIWKKIRQRNELLDLTAYSLCMVQFLGIGFLLQEAELIQRSGEQ